MRARLLLVAALTLPAAARAEVGQWTAQLRPGYADILGSKVTSDLFQGSFNLSGSADYQFQEMAAAGLDLGYSIGHKLQGTLNGQSFTSDVSVPFGWVTPYVKLTKTVTAGGRTWTTYAVLGVGWYHNPNRSGTGTSGGVSGPISVQGEDRWGVNVGPGIMTPIDDRWSVGADLRFHDAVKNHETPDIILIPSLTVSYRF